MFSGKYRLVGYLSVIFLALVICLIVTVILSDMSNGDVTTGFINTFIHDLTTGW